MTALAPALQRRVVQPSPSGSPRRDPCRKPMPWTCGGACKNIIERLASPTSRLLLSRARDGFAAAPTDHGERHRDTRSTTCARPIELHPVEQRRAPSPRAAGGASRAPSCLRGQSTQPRRNASFAGSDVTALLMPQQPAVDVLHARRRRHRTGDRLHDLIDGPHGSVGRARCIRPKPMVKSWKNVLSLPSRLGATSIHCVVDDEHRAVAQHDDHVAHHDEHHQPGRRSRR